MSDYSAKYLIERRKEKWSSLNSLDEDKRFREAVANELITNENLRIEVRNNPEYLIELEFVIVDKMQKTVPFFINDVQQEFLGILNKAKEKYQKNEILDLTFVILKGRQQGFTSFITAYQLASLIVSRNFQGFTLADKAENTETIFQNKAKFPYDQLPESIQPTEKFNNKRQLLFEKLNSNWSVDTATEDVGRSRTINFFHGSECAFWKGMAKIQAGLGEAFTKDCIKIYESTANGFNDFETLWSNESAIKCFFEWWKTKEYRLNFENEDAKKEFLENLKRKDWIFERINFLLSEKHLELEQVYWYYQKYQGYIEKELIKQEYPCSPEEAFLSSGNCVFDKENVINRIERIRQKEPIKRGSFLFDYDGLTIRNIKWQDDPNGIIKIYKDVEKKKPYVLSGDTAGDGSDNFVGEVLDNISGEQVAELSHKTDEDLYARQMYCLGMYYNQALIGIEVNFSTYPEKELERLNYPKLYQRQVEDSITHKRQLKYGFKTTSITRPIIIAGLVEVIRDDIDTINSVELLRECLSFVRNDKGRAEAEQGKHDDRVMAMAIAHYIRPQQVMNVEEEKEKTGEEIREERNFDAYVNYGMEDYYD